MDVDRGHAVPFLVPVRSRYRAGVIGCREFALPVFVNLDSQA
jgi:hypothetical protein